LICLIVLAAGLSKRFGRNKLLEKIDDSTIIERVVKSAVASKADEIVVVLGHEAQMIKGTLKDVKCRFIFNENYEIGQSSSIKAGVNSVMGCAEAVLVLPGDMALITPEAINMVIEEYKKSRSHIVVASHRGRLGHPILFDRFLFGQIMNINEETMGLKSVVNANRGLIKKVETGSDEILIDFDSEEDLKRYFPPEGTEDQ
jgi:molybdenum cofactor cytidylyltransferase